MKTAAVILLAGLAGLTLSVRAFQGTDGATEPKTQSTYSANGQVESECETLDGRRDGLCRRYYADGRKMAEGRYVAGKMEGPWTFWLEDGTVDRTRSGRFDSGERAGP
jgi:antitoxin component YwqK of YwqJK toxin-antitoxin module